MTENEFRWAVINAVVGGVGGSASVVVLDRVGVALEAVAAGWGSNIRREFDEFRADWRDHLAMEADWERVYRDALTVNTIELCPGWSPAERVLHHLWSFVEYYQVGLERLIQVAILFAGEAVAAAHALGLVLDQGARPPVVLVDAEVAPVMGYTAPGLSLRLPTLREFVRELPNPDHTAWRLRCSEWAKRHTSAGSRFDESEPPSAVPIPHFRKSGEFPPATSWAGSLRMLWEKVGLDRYRSLPDDVETIPDSNPAGRNARVEHLVTLAYAGFDGMRLTSAAGGRPSPPTSEELSGMVEREWAAKLTDCTPKERQVFMQYTVAAARLALSPGGITGDRGPTDRAAYEWIKANEGEAWHLPAEFETWSRYLRAARTKVGEPKNRPRRGRGGRSIIGLDGDDPSDPGGGS